MHTFNNQDSLLGNIAEMKRRAELVGYSLLNSPSTENAGRRILNCATEVGLPAGINSGKPNYINFCNHRQCPTCQERRAKRACAAMHQLFDQNPNLVDGKWLFLTLTVRNCSTRNLKETLARMSDAFQRLTRRTFWQQNVLGAIRFTEVSVGQSDPCTAHPHFHCLLLVRPSMFAGIHYMSEERWASAWADVLQEHYIPTINVQRLNCPPNEVRTQVVSMAGYSSKARLETPDPQWLIEVTQQMRGYRSVQAYGLLARPQLQPQVYGVTEDACQPFIPAGRFTWNRITKQYQRL
jgi:hypothetical protein